MTAYSMHRGGTCAHSTDNDPERALPGSPEVNKNLPWEEEQLYLRGPGFTCDGWEGILVRLKSDKLAFRMGWVAELSP